MMTDGSNSALALGSAGTPSLKFAGDANTGIFSPGADQLSITTGGTERLRVDGAGQIEAVSLGSAAAPTFSFTGDPNTGIYSPGADQVAVTTNGVQRLTVDTAATTSALPVLHPLGAVGTPSITFTGDLNTGFWSPTADTLAASTAGSERLRITSAGNVGIGASLPTTGLLVTKGGANQLAIEPSDSAAYGRLDVGHFPNGTFIGTYAGTDPASNLLRFGTSGTERLRITSAGFVGIGTTSPVSPLEVSSASNTQIRAVTTDATGASIAGLLLDQQGAGASTFIVRAGSNYSVLGTTTNTPVLFTANNAERARIDSSGRLLVGTSTNTGGSLFQVNDNRIRIATAKTPASATDTGSAGEICWDANYIYVCTATNTWKRTAIATW
jgi:hypothetical protein